MAVLVKPGGSVGVADAESRARLGAKLTPTRPYRLPLQLPSCVTRLLAHPRSLTARFDAVKPIFRLLPQILAEQLVAIELQCLGLPGLERNVGSLSSIHKASVSQHKALLTVWVSSFFHHQPDYVVVPAGPSH